MKKYKLGDLIKKVDGNKNRQLKDLPLLGINIDKEFMPSVANTIGTDMSNYQIVKKEQFACNPMHLGRDERMPTALLLSDDKILVSPAYFVFEIIDKNIVLPEYLMLYFKRSETDRLLWFKTDSSVRGGLGWEELCAVKIMLPSIEKQQKIISQYNQINTAIKIKEKLNNNLEQQALNIYTENILKNSDNFVKGQLSDIADITMGQSPDGSSYNTDGKGKLFYQGRAEFGFRYPKERLYTTEPNRIAQKGDVLMSVRAPVGDINIALKECCIGRGLAAIKSKNNAPSFLFYTLITLKKDLDLFNGEGTVFGSINKDTLSALDVIIPPADTINKFENIVEIIDLSIKKNVESINNLTVLRDILLPKLMLENS